MKSGVLKNSIILIISLGSIAQTFNNIAFAVPAIPDGGEVLAATAKVEAATGLAGALTPFIANCVPGTFGTSPGAIAPGPAPLLGGICQQNVAIAANQAAKEAADLAGKAKTFSQKILDFAAKISYTLFKRVILDRLVDAIIQWINRGGQGGIVEDWEQFFDDAANIAAGEFVQGLGAGFLCSPFSVQLQFALIPVDRFSKFSCTLDQIIGNINNFFEDFRSGNWLAYQETWYPRNNFYGGTIIAIDESAKAEALAKDAAEKEAVAGRGFLSFKKCDLFVNPKGNLDRNGNPVGPDYQGTRFKNECRVVTPGEVPAQMITRALADSTLTSIIHAEDLSVYLTAIVDAGINKLTVLATDGLRGLVARNAPPRVNPQFPCAGLTGDAFRVCINSINLEKTEFTSSQDDLLSATTGSLDTRNQLAAVLSQSILLQKSYVEALEELIALGKGAGRESELAEEQAILDSLNDQFESNQSFLEVLSGIDNKITSIEPSTAVTPENWITLGGSINNQFLDDSISAVNSLSDAQKELQKIQEKINANLPGILSQLPAGTATGQ